MNARANSRRGLRQVNKEPLNLVLAGSGNSELAAKKMSGSCFFHEPLTGGAGISPARPFGLRGSGIIWVSLRSYVLLGPSALARPAGVVVGRLDVAVAPLGAVAEQLDVVAGLPLSARFRCVQEQADVLTLQPEPASLLRV